MSRVVSQIIVIAATSLGGQAAQAQNLAGEVKACRQMAEPNRRLACYDGLALPTEPGSAAMNTTGAAPVATAIDPVAKFGQEAIKHPAATELKQIESRILGKFHGWRAGSQLELENGQIWRVADGSEANYDLQDPKVIVHRGMLGAFYLEIEGVGFQTRVTRVR